MSANFVLSGVDARIVQALSTVNLSDISGSQAAAFTSLMKGRSVTLEVESEEKRTLTVLVPAIHRIIVGIERGQPQLLVVTSTGAAAERFGKLAHLVAKPLGLTVATPRMNARAIPAADIVVGTTECLLKTLGLKLFNAGHVGDVVVDGIDEMFGASKFAMLRDLLDWVPAGRRTVCIAQHLEAEQRAKISELFPDSIIINSNGTQVGGPGDTDFRKRGAIGVLELNTLFRGYQFKDAEIVAIALDVLGTAKPDLAPHFLSLLGFSAARRGLTELYCRDRKVQDFKAALTWISNAMARGLFEEVATNLNLSAEVYEGAGDLSPAMILIRAISALQIDGGSKAVEEFFLRTQAFWLTDVDGEPNDSANSAVLYPLHRRQLDLVESEVPHFFRDKRWPQAALAGYAKENGQIAPDLSLALRGEAALELTLVNLLRTNRALQRPDLLATEFTGCRSTTSLFASPRGIALQRALNQAARRTLSHDEGSVAFYALCGAIEADGGPTALQKATAAWIPFAATSLRLGWN